MSSRILVKPLILTTLFGAASIGGARIYRYETDLARKEYDRWYTKQETNTFEYFHYQKAQANPLTRIFLDIRLGCKIWYQQLTACQKITYATIFANCMVFCAWQTRLFEPVMQRYFVSRICGSKIRVVPLLLSCFSHKTMLHLGCNMLVLNSLAPAVNSTMDTDEMVGLYLAAGTFAYSLSLSHLIVGETTIIRSSVGSLGASGALMAFLAYYCTTHPEARLSVLWTVPVSAKTALIGLIGVDLIGIVLKWRYLDHAAHLGGAVFGILYTKMIHPLYISDDCDVIEDWLKIKRMLKLSDPPSSDQ